MNDQAQPPAEAEALLQTLLAEIESGTIQLPGFPDVVWALQPVLNDPDTDVDQIVQALSVEPALAMQVLRIANSATFNIVSQQARDLHAAVRRIGRHMVRAAALAFAVHQLRNAEEHRAIRVRVDAQWRRGVVVGAIARALATQLRVVSPDISLLAGLLHVVGRLYVLTRLQRSPWLLDQPGLAEHYMEQCGGNADVALLRSWGLSPEFALAITQYNNPDRDQAGLPGLTDVLAAAVVLADLLPPSRTDYLDQIQLANVYLHTEPLWRRLGLSRENCSDALHRALEDMQPLRAVFGA